jgi:fructokinase
MRATRTLRCIGLGEVLWDLLPTGKQLGGAPANFAYHAHALGAEGVVISRIGDDALGREIFERLRNLGLRTDGITIDPNAPTGTVSVALDAQGHPSYTIHENVAWDRITADEAALAQAQLADAICFGSLAQRSETSWQNIRALVGATPSPALRIFDINLRQHFYSREIIEASLHLANVLKINDTELPVLAHLFELPGDARGQITELAARFDLRCVALTRGGSGSLLFSNGQWAEHPGLRVAVQDTIGAGDAFTAAMALGFLAGWPLELVNQRANEVAAFVCSQSGATPLLPAELRQIFAPQGS